MIVGNLVASHLVSDGRLTAVGGKPWYYRKFCCWLEGRAPARPKFQTAAQERCPPE